MPKTHELDPMQRVRFALDAAVVWLFFFIGWSAFYLANQAQAAALGAQRRLADAESAAQAAQVRALRYQVNPHFLFNTLNSLSSLVMTGRTDRAETMLLALSTFFRTSLSLDPTADVTPGGGNRSPAALSRYREGALPRPASCRDRRSARARAGAAPSPAAAADRRKCDQIWRVEEPQGDPHPDRRAAPRQSPHGARDLQSPEAWRQGRASRRHPRRHRARPSNVCQRLEARWGSRASCRYGPMAGGGYKVSLTMPVEMHVREQAA